MPSPGFRIRRPTGGGLSRLWRRWRSVRNRAQRRATGPENGAIDILARKASSSADETRSSRLARMALVDRDAAAHADCAPLRGSRSTEHREHTTSAKWSMPTSLASG